MQPEEIKKELEERKKYALQNIYTLDLLTLNSQTILKYGRFGHLGFWKWNEVRTNLIEA